MQYLLRKTCWRMRPWLPLVPWFIFQIPCIWADLSGSSSFSWNLLVLCFILFHGSQIAQRLDLLQPKWPNIGGLVSCFFMFFFAHFVGTGMGMALVQAQHGLGITHIQHRACVCVRARSELEAKWCYLNLSHVLSSEKGTTAGVYVILGLSMAESSTGKRVSKIAIWRHNSFLQWKGAECC